jgi:hypothetical protein
MSELKFSVRLNGSTVDVRAVEIERNRVLIIVEGPVTDLKIRTILNKAYTVVRSNYAIDKSRTQEHIFSGHRIITFEIMGDKKIQTAFLRALGIPEDTILKAERENQSD